MIHSIKKEYIAFPFKEDEVGLIEEAAKLKDTRSRRNKEFTREEDYVIYTFWEKKPMNELAKLLKTSWQTIKPRYEYLISKEADEYVISLLKEFASDETAS